MTRGERSHILARMSTEESWARGAYSLWTGGEDCASWAPEKARTSLDDWYGAGDGEETLDTIHELCEGEPADAAWDMVRALDLLRIALAAQYIDAATCRAEIATIASALQRRYASWEELAVGFEAGMHAWYRGNGVTNEKQLARVQRNLPKLRAEIWPTIAFETALAAT